MLVMNQITLIKLSIQVLLLFLSGHSLQRLLPRRVANLNFVALQPSTGKQTGQPVNQSVLQVPTSHLVSFNRNVDIDLAFYNRQLELVNEFALNLKAIYQKHFEDKLRVRFNRHQNLTKFVFNKKCLLSKLKNSTYRTAYVAYLQDLQSAFNQFELLAQKLQHLIELTARAKEKINLETAKAEIYVDNGLGELPIKHALMDYTQSIAKEIRLVKEQIKFHFFNFFFLTKLLLAKEKWIAENAFNPIKNAQSITPPQLGPIHKLAFSNQTFQIKIIDLINKKQFLETI